MTARSPSAAANTARSFLLAGAGGCVLAAAWVLVAPGDRVRTRGVLAARPAPEGQQLARPLAAESPARVPLVADSTPNRAAADEDPSAPSGAAAAAVERPVTEHDYLARFLARAREDPDSLAREARAVLAGDGPRCAKVALLRALEARDPLQAVAWLELATRSVPHVSDAQGESVPTFALGRLQAHAREAAGARDALARLAFDAPDLADDLRRRAASALAAVCPARELGGLRVHLVRETDALLVDGVRAALAERAGDATAQALLADLPAAQGTSR